MTYGLAIPISLVEQLVHAAELRATLFTEAEAILSLRLHVDRALRDPRAWPKRSELARAWGWEDRAVRSLLERRDAWLTAMETTPGQTADAWALVEEEMDRRSGELERRRRTAATVEALVFAGAELLDMLDEAFRQDSARTPPGFRQGETEERREPPEDTPGTRQGSARNPPHARPQTERQIDRPGTPPTPRPGRGGPTSELVDAAVAWLSDDGQALLPLVLAGKRPDNATAQDVRKRMDKLRLLPAGTRTDRLASALVEAAPLVVPHAAQEPPPAPTSPAPLETTPELAMTWSETLAWARRQTDEVDAEELDAMLRSCAPQLVALDRSGPVLACPSVDQAIQLDATHRQLLDVLREALGGSSLTIYGPDWRAARSA